MSGAPQSKKPLNTNFRQQTLPAWQPMLTPKGVISILGVIGLAFVILGSVFLQLSQEVVELQYQYDGSGSDGDSCKITSSNEGKSCTVSLKATAKMKSPIYVYYQITNFYQNHRQYVKSYSYKQLLGDYTLSKEDLEGDCSSLRTNGSKVLNPCGLVANSLFNDQITVATDTFAPMYTNNIAWASDVDEKYQQPGHGDALGLSYKKKFIHAKVTIWNQASAVKSSCIGSGCSDDICDYYLGDKGWDATDSSCKGYYCGTISSDGTQTDYSSGYAHLFNCEAGSTHVYWYPEQSSTQYIYETFPEVISPLMGVKSPNFAVWMRTAALPKFRKLYGKIAVDIPEGESIEFDIVNNFAVNSFKGTKSIIVTTTSWIGGKNNFLGVSFIVVGSLCLTFAVAFLLKSQLNPRIPGDTKKLYG